MWMSLVRTGIHVCTWKDEIIITYLHFVLTLHLMQYLQPWERSFFWQPTVSRTMHDSVTNLPNQICQCRLPLVFVVPMHPFRTEPMTHGKCHRLRFSMDANCQFCRSSYDDPTDRDMVPPKRYHLHLNVSMKMDLRRRAIQDCCHGIHSICTAFEKKK